MSDKITDDLSVRIRKLQNRLKENEIDLAILSQNSDIYYFSGSVQPQYILIPVASKPVVLARKAITRIELEVESIELEPFSGTKDLARIFQKYNLSASKRVGFTLDTITYSSVMRMKKLFKQADIVDLSWEVRTLRMIKSEAEISIQTQAGKIMAEWPELVRKNLKPGMTELDLSIIIENHARLNRHGSFVRSRREGNELPGYGVCTSGINSLTGTRFDGICAGKGLSAPNPYGASSDIIRTGSPILLDFGFNLDGYVVDQTRMCSIGKPSNEIIDAYDAMLHVEETILKSLKPGVVWEDIYNNSAQLASEMGYSDTYMGVGTERVKFVGHGVGLELDELPLLASGLKYPIETNMVIAVEPKVALPGVGVIGIEDTIVVKNNGIDVLTICPKEFIVIE